MKKTRKKLLLIIAPFVVALLLLVGCQSSDQGSFTIPNVWQETADVSSVPVPVSTPTPVEITAAEGEPANGFTWENNYSEITITGYVGASNEPIIPDKINGKPVTKIAEKAFKGFKSMTSIHIPVTLAEIGIDALSECEGLKTISYGGTLKQMYKIGGQSLLIKHMHKLIIQGVELTEVTISPDDSVPSYMFAYCSGLKTAVFEEGVNCIPDDIFMGCEALMSVTIPEGVTGIGSGAFGYCTKLTSVTLPESVIEIGRGAFENCEGITSLKVPANVESISYRSFSNMGIKELYWNPRNYQNSRYSDDGLFDGCNDLSTVVFGDGVESIPAEMLMNCTGLKNLTIPDSVKDIGDAAFAGCTGLKKLTVPEHVEMIGLHSFAGCTGIEELYWNAASAEFESYGYYRGDIYSICGPDSALRTVVFGDRVKKIPSELIAYCHNITALVIPEGVTQIGSYSFYGCDRLAQITLPSSLTSIGDYAFQGCNALKKVVYNGTLENWLKVEMEEGGNPFAFGAPFEFGGKALTKLVVPDGVTRISENAFSGCTTLVSVTIPDSVTEIGQEAFKGCTSLETLKIGKGVKTLGSRAFEDCKKLKRVVFPEGLTEIPYAAFYNCTALTEIVLPKSVTDYWITSFGNCPNLKTVYTASSKSSSLTYHYYYSESLNKLYLHDLDWVYNYSE